MGARRTTRPAGARPASAPTERPAEAAPAESAAPGPAAYTLGMKTPGVEVNYLTLQEFFNGEVAGIGNLVDAIRGKLVR